MSKGFGRCALRVTVFAIAGLLLLAEARVFDLKKQTRPSSSAPPKTFLADNSEHIQPFSSHRWDNVSGGAQRPEPSISNSAANAALMGSVASWVAISWEALMKPHPNPAVAATLCLRHDVLTFSQALAFQLPVIVAAYFALKQNNGVDETLHRRLLLGIGTMSLWTGSAVFFCKTFSRGFELFSTTTKYAIATIQTAIALWAFSNWKKSVQFSSMFPRLIRGSIGSIMSLVQDIDGNVDDPDDTKANDNALYTASAIGLLALAAMPQLVSFPTATIPTILGKRFSRAASGVTFLAGVLAYCIRDSFLSSNGNSISIQTLRKGLGFGVIGHLCLVIGKFVGVDGGGLVLPGDGLWVFYPSMVNASRAATTLMLVTFMTTAFVCTRKTSSKPKMNE